MGTLGVRFQSGLGTYPDILPFAAAWHETPGSVEVMHPGLAPPGQQPGRFTRVAAAAVISTAFWSD